MSRKASDPDPLRAVVDEALALLSDYQIPSGAGPVSSDPLPTLLDQCRAATQAAAEQAQEPIRTIHHFACTGGTVICKCLALMPNVQLLSEIDPLSTMDIDQRNPLFTPTDLIRHLRYSHRSVSEATIVATFLAGLSSLHADLGRVGQRLVLRDHAHSQFCHGPEIARRPTLRAILARHFATRSVLTVRDPLDSYLSLVNAGWEHFQPAGIDEYSRRYLAFLDSYPDVEIHHYEDFIADPEAVLQAVCTTLCLPYAEGVPALMAAVWITGDSGRSSERIKARPRRPVPGPIEDQIKESVFYGQLRERLRY